jgi:chaperonin GroES
MLPGRYTRVVPRATSANAPKEPKPRKPRARKASLPGPEIKLTADRLIVRVPENGERKTSGGLLIPATAMPAPRRLQWGDVALVGPDVRVAKQGDRVLFLPSSGLEVELDGEELVLLRERDVQAVSSKPSTERAPGQYL